jgi:hypothetical protein
VTALADVVGPSQVLTDPDVTASYERDWTGRFAGRAAAVVRPGSTAEVAAVMAPSNSAPDLDAAEDALIAAASAGRAERLAFGHDELWCPPPRAATRRFARDRAVLSQSRP